MKRVVILWAVAALLNGCASRNAEKYEPTWKSLAKHEAEPEWLKDAKLGIYFHWGPYSVPAYGNEWYPRWMHFENRNEYKHHLATYGKPSEFGYHDFVPLFTGEHFDAAEWAELFRKAGAKFAGPVAEHHDGFSMWDSEITPWNAADKGPKQDILGNLFAELEKRDMKTIATFHHARNLQRYSDKPAEKGFQDSHYPWIEGQPPTSDDPELRLLYGNVPEEEWNETIWLGKLKEVIDHYQPDIIWFDSWLDRIPETYRQRFAAYYLNQAEKWNKDVAIIRKQNDLPLTFSINDHEKSREPKALKELWMTDDTISTGSWCYTQDLKIKPLSMVIHAVVDTVAKNGVVLLNISPKADGTIPQDQRDVLLGLGAWLNKNGEAIYSTRPWINAAEGPTAEPEGGFAARKKFMALKYTEKDIRYTASKDGKTVYAIIMGIPKAGSEVLFKTFAAEKIAVKRVSTLNGSAVDWSMTDNGLSVKAVATDDTAATVYKVEL
ncbi:alpha-L-fucosidase [Pontiella sp. NLcol2]|uniref:alpha-L-fucosidase n=2 Tax=Pontiella agarivorans TaxID=3038953 RepID=A0ABU5MX59_9BACT|nr:alpha-L-fucosidase [Pontiella agarivorans]